MRFFLITLSVGFFQLGYASNTDSHIRPTTSIQIPVTPITPIQIPVTPITPIQIPVTPITPIQIPVIPITPIKILSKECRQFLQAYLQLIKTCFQNVDTTVWNTMEDSLAIVGSFGSSENVFIRHMLKNLTTLNHYISHLRNLMQTVGQSHCLDNEIFSQIEEATNIVIVLLDQFSSKIVVALQEENISADDVVKFTTNLFNNSYNEIYRTVTNCIEFLENHV